jgi:hypothetical protein
VGLRRGNRKAQSTHPNLARAGFRRQAFWLGLVLMAVITVVALNHFTHPSASPLPAATPSTPPPIAPTAQKAFTLDKLLAMTPEELKDVDIAEMNLLCAKGLPEAENLDIGHAMSTLDGWAARVAFETNRHFYRLNDPKYADEYHHSEPYMRSSMLLQVLQEDLGVKYDMAAKDDFSFKDSRVAFIHGMIPMPGQTLADTPGGTCASMPVLYVAVGRRLGYPLKLVTTRGHVFVRWDGKDHPDPAWRERLNIEGSGQGFGSFDDDYYKTWPFKVTDTEVKAQGYLLSLSPTEELALFLSSRGHCGTNNGQLVFAARCFENACGYDPNRRCFQVWFLDAAAKCGYQPTIPALATMLAQRTQRLLADPERIVAAQEDAARREWLLANPGFIPAGGPPRFSPGVPRPLPPGVPPPILPARP